MFDLPKNPLFGFLRDWPLVVILNFSEGIWYMNQGKGILMNYEKKTKNEKKRRKEVGWMV